MPLLTRKYLQERFEEHNLKVSCLYPEVHDRLKKQTFPAPLIQNMLVITFSLYLNWYFFLINVKYNYSLLYDV